MSTDRILNLGAAMLSVSVFASLAILASGEAHGASVAPTATVAPVASQGPAVHVRGPRTPCPNDENTGESGHACVWDAVHRGNGRGRSFIVTPSGDLRFISHARAHALTFGASS